MYLDLIKKYASALIAAICVAIGAWGAWTVQGWRLDALQARYDGFVLQTRVLGVEATKEAKRINEQHQKTLEEVSNAWNSQLQPARDGAVRAYLARHPAGLCDPSPGSGSLPGDAGNPESSHGAGQKSLATGSASRPDETFIRDCADDALKIGLWQDWAIKNQLPMR